MAKHIPADPAPEQEVQSLGVDLDPPGLAEGEDANEYQNNARELSDLSEATFQHCGVFLAFRSHVAIG